jgi:hypothetical protein
LTLACFATAYWYVVIHSAPSEVATQTAHGAESPLALAASEPGLPEALGAAPAGAETRPLAEASAPEELG